MYAYRYYWWKDKDLQNETREIAKELHTVILQLIKLIRQLEEKKSHDGALKIETHTQDWDNWEMCFETYTKEVIKISKSWG